LVDIELVLPLDRHEDPRLRGMEIEMPRSEAVSGSRRDRGKVAQRAAVKCKDLERAGIFQFAVGGVVAARHQDCGAVSRRRADLMPIDAGIGLGGLSHASPIEPSRLMWCTVTLLGALWAVSRYSPDASTLVWIGRDGSACGSPCGSNAPERGSMRNALARCVVPATPGPPSLDTT